MIKELPSEVTVHGHSTGKVSCNKRSTLILCADVELYIKLESRVKYQHLCYVLHYTNTTDRFCGICRLYVVVGQPSECHKTSAEVCHLDVTKCPAAYSLSRNPFSLPVNNRLSLWVSHAKPTTVIAWDNRVKSTLNYSQIDYHYNITWEHCSVGRVGHGPSKTLLGPVMPHNSYSLLMIMSKLAEYIGFS